MLLKIKNIIEGKKTANLIPYIVVSVDVLQAYYIKVLGEDTAFCIFDKTKEDLDFKIGDTINLKGYRLKQGSQMKMIGAAETWEVLHGI